MVVPLCEAAAAIDLGRGRVARKDAHWLHHQPGLTCRQNLNPRHETATRTNRLRQPGIGRKSRTDDGRRGRIQFTRQAARRARFGNFLADPMTSPCLIAD